MRRAQFAVLLPGAYAWSSTVAWPCFEARSPLAVGGALGSLAALSAGVLRAGATSRLGRALGLGGFTLSALLGWSAAEDQLGALAREPARALLGVAAWGLFALGWGAFPVRRRAPEDDPRARLQEHGSPRRRAPSLPGTVTSLACVCCVVLIWLALRVSDPAVALLAQAVALALCLGLLSVCAPACLAPQPSRSGGLYDALLVGWCIVGGVFL